MNFICIRKTSRKVGKKCKMPFIYRDIRFLGKLIAQNDQIHCKLNPHKLICDMCAIRNKLRTSEFALIQNLVFCLPTYFLLVQTLHAAIHIQNLGHVKYLGECRIISDIIGGSIVK